MTVHTIRLKEFTEPVPTCSGTDSLSNALEVMSQAGSDRLILVDSWQRPKGIIRLHRLVPYLSKTDGLSQMTGLTAESTIPQHFLSNIAPLVAESLTILPGDWSVEQFLPYLRLQDQSHVFVLAGLQGECLGGLDYVRLLKFLANYPQEIRETGNTDRFSMQQDDIARSENLPNLVIQQQRQITLLTQQLLAQKAEFEMRLQTQHQHSLECLKMSNASVPGLTAPNSPSLALPDDLRTSPLSAELLVSPSDLLPAILERLPLPLMLQTTHGKVLAQNSIWRRSVGELLDPDWVGRDAATLLADPQQKQESVGQNHPIDGEWERSTHHSAGSTALPSQPDMLGTLPAPLPSLCQVGAQPGTCICFCPDKDGQERVLQLIRIPIEPVSFDLGLSLEDSAIAPEDLVDSRSHHIFQLAPLGDSSEPTLSYQHSHTPGEQSSAARMGTGAIAQADEHAQPNPTRTASSRDVLWLVLAQDITEQQQIARELTAKNADLVQLNRLKDEFLACISHELKTPLTAVLGLSSLLKDQTLGELNQRQARYAQLIYQSGRHLMTVVNDILDLTCIETGQLELMPTPVDIATVCSRAFDQATQLRLLEAKPNEDNPATSYPNSQFSLKIEPGLDTLVADEFRLRQMLVNLLSNALKFTAPDKQLGLKVNRWGGWIAFTVWDTGIGIPADKQHLIFQKFQQLESPLTRRFEGTGLGLVLTQRLARLHGGDVTFISKEDQGSQFTILLPPIPAQKTSPSALSGDRDRLNSSDILNDTFVESTTLYPRDVPDRNSSRRFSAQLSANALIDPEQRAAHRNQLALIVEAVPQCIDTLSDHLTGLGYRIVIARAGTEAVEKARRLQPCVIFLNPLLPLLSGWDVLTLLKSNLETRHLPVIVTATPIDEEQAYRNCANGFLTLPIQIKTLQQTLRQILRKVEATETQRHPANHLTILRLSPESRATTSPTGSTLDLNQLLHAHHYRILEADDLEQAELLVRVWKPNLAVLDGTTSDWGSYFQHLSQHTFLASLPLVTLDWQATQAANQIPGLLIFPCLAALDTTPGVVSQQELSPLLQVIRVAAGYVWQPSILALEVSALPLSATSSDVQDGSDHVLGGFPKEPEWLKAFVQYLQTAGLRGIVSHSWEEVLQQVQSQGVDLLLISCKTCQLQPATMTMLSILQQLETKPPILVLDHRHHCEPDQVQSTEALPDLVQQLATQVLPPSLSMAELLRHIQQTLQERQSHLA
jgi:signal transduction histidine kinase/CheY-like chemotaxis protein